MCNHFDVITKGKSLCQVGWSLQKVGPSVCVELPIESKKRSQIIECNETLASTSGGMLPMPSGKERVRGLHQPHLYFPSMSREWMQMDGGDDLAGGSHLSLEQLIAKGDDLGRMLTEGWEGVCGQSAGRS